MKFSLVDFDDWSKVATFEAFEDDATFTLKAKVDVDAFLNEECYLSGVTFEEDVDVSIPHSLTDKQLNDMMDEFEAKYQRFLNDGEY